ncbi:hypothetical protein NDU88_007085 [Pleurodeles waltl]|uniref:Uncharacterized protein n=1 Tax=Pleurodeles waltl TaxID=8319 RepID=A0AAV7NS34_PLEWA|nr:hypothetical protein NDU88_007085 [Pleurodeles waltl]
MDDDDVYGTVHILHAVQPDVRRGLPVPKCVVAVDGHRILVLNYARASVNIMAQPVFQSLLGHPTLKHTATQVYAFGSPAPLPVAGIFTATITHEDQTTKAKI